MPLVCTLCEHVGLQHAARGLDAEGSLVNGQCTGWLSSKSWRDYSPVPHSWFNQVIALICAVGLEVLKSYLLKNLSKVNQKKLFILDQFPFL